MQVLGDEEKAWLIFLSTEPSGLGDLSLWPSAQWWCSGALWLPA